MLTRNVDFSKGGDVIQPSTPKKVRTTVFFEHSIQVEVDLEILNGDSVISKERLILGNEFMLARVSNEFQKGNTYCSIPSEGRCLLIKSDLFFFFFPFPFFFPFERQEDFSTGELQLPSYDDSSSQPPPSTIAS